jgi:hypothetical protein
LPDTPPEATGRPVRRLHVSGYTVAALTADAITGCSCVRHEAHCYIARVAGMDWRRCLWI